MMNINSTSASLRGNFVLLKADGLRLLLPQSDVGSAEYLPEHPRSGGQAGLFELDTDGDGPTRHVAALSSRMTLLPEFPAHRFLMAAVGGPDGVALCWDEIRMLIDTDLQTLPLPAVMLSPEAPLREFVELDDGIAFCCTGERLLAHALAMGA
jgi:hypothetical protein